MSTRRDVVRPILIGGVVGLFAALCFSVGVFQSFSNLATDKLFLSRSPDPSIAIVAVDDASISQIGRWPWPRKVHAQIISNLKAAGVKAIGYDVNFPEASDNENDTALETALHDAGNVVLPIELTLNQQHDQIVLDPTGTVAPIAMLASAAKATGHTNTPPDSDGVVRRVPLIVASPDGGRVPSFAAQVLRLVNPAFNFGRAPVDALGRLIVNYDGPPKKTFPTIAAIDVYRGTADLSKLAGKIVFVGATAADLHDTQLVPTSGGEPMPGVEIHASLTDTLITGRWLRDVPVPFVDALLVLLGLALGLLITFVRARYNLPIAIIAWIGLTVASFVLFDRGWVLDVVWPGVTIVFAYGSVTLERRITADRERRQLKTAFSRYVSASVVASILKDPSKLKLGGDRRRMTVLFSDVRGFTTISESLSPEKLVEVMNTYLTRMTDIVFEQDGVLDKYIGDAVMAFWNAPFDQPDHALRAITTALRMQAALTEMNVSNAFPNGITLKIGVGINTGDMIVGNMGSETRFDYTVIGDNVNLASRMESVTKEYSVGILISEATRQEVADKVLTRRIDKVAVKGKKEPIMMYEALSLASNATSEQKMLVSDFEAALEAYFKRDFADAISRCEKILQTHPDDGPSKTLVERSRHFISDPPPTDWVGTWVMTKK